jgi:hypothetical protein
MTPRELAEEAREALRRDPPRSAREEIQRLVDAGIIELLGNGEIKVLTTKLFGDDDDEKPKKRRSSRKARKSHKERGQ